jgi:hypothetical protein
LGHILGKDENHLSQAGRYEAGFGGDNEEVLPDSYGPCLDSCRSASRLSVDLARHPGVRHWPGWIKYETSSIRSEEAFSWDTRQIEIVGADGDSEQFPLKSTGITPDIEGTVMALRRPLWLILRKEYPLLVYDDEEQKSAWFNELAGRFNQTPMNASFKVTEDDRGGGDRFQARCFGQS